MLNAKQIIIHNLPDVTIREVIDFSPFEFHQLEMFGGQKPFLEEPAKEPVTSPS